MASYVIGNASWTNGSHKVTFSALATRPAVFVGCFDNNFASQGYHIDVTASSGWTSTNTFDDPTASYTTFGTNQRLRTCNTANSATYVRYFPSTQGTSPYGDVTAGRAVTNGATKLHLLIWTVGNTNNDWVMRVTPSSGGSIDITLPNTTDSQWHELVLDLPSTITTALNSSIPLEIRKTGGAFFNVGDQVAVSTAYIASATTNTIVLTDTISPDGGTTNYTIDKVVNNNATGGTLYVVYIKEAYTGTSGTYSTSRTELSTGQPRDLTATIVDESVVSSGLSNTKAFTATIGGTSDASATFGIERIILLTGDIGATSSASANLTRAIPKYFTASLASSSGVLSSLELTGGIYSLGNATWTNGSKIVTFTTANTHIVMLNDFYPYTDANTGGLVTAGEWGTGGLDPGGTDFQPGVPQYTSDRKTTAITYKIPLIYQDNFPSPISNSQMCRLSRSGSSTYLNSTGLQVLNFVAAIDADTANRNNISVCASANTTASPDTSNPVYLGANGWNTIISNSWRAFVAEIPNNIATFKQLSIFHTQDNTVANETVWIDSVYLTDKSSQAIMMTDRFTPDGGATTYAVDKVLQSSAGVITLVLRTAFTGTTGTYTTSRIPAKPFGQTLITNQGDVSAGGLTRLQLLIANIFGNNTVSSTFGKIITPFTTIASSSAVNSGVGIIKNITTSIIGSSVVVSTLGYAKLMGETLLDGVSSVSAGVANSIRGINTTITGTGDITSSIVKELYYVGNIDGTSDVSAAPSFVVGIMPTEISATSSLLPAHITKHSFIETVIAGTGEVTVPFEWQPVMLFSADINAAGDITNVMLVKDLTLNGVVYSQSELNVPLINRDRPFTGGIDGVSNVKSWLDVPQKLRELIINSSGVVITDDADGNVLFTTREKTGYITIRGITAIELNDAVNNTKQTIIVMM